VRNRRFKKLWIMQINLFVSNLLKLRITTAREYKEAYKQFAIGLHALQDATSPTHAGFQVWTGEETIKQEVNHISKSCFILAQ